MWARQRSADTAATSIEYARPAMDCSKRWTAEATCRRDQCEVLGTRRIVRSARALTSEAPYERASTEIRARDLQSDATTKKNFRCRNIHRKFTVHPQDFHTPPA